jgi:LAO/AO transport system kinase
MKSRFANWQPQVLACSSTQNKGIEEVWEQVTAFRTALDGELQQQRAQQARSWMWAETAEALVSDLKNDAKVKALVPELEQAVLDGLLPATVAAQRLIDTFKS